MECFSALKVEVIIFVVHVVVEFPAVDELGAGVVVVGVLPVLECRVVHAELDNVMFSQVCDDGALILIFHILAAKVMLLLVSWVDSERVDVVFVGTPC